MTEAYCPQCGGRISLFGSIKIGQRLTCAGCGAELEVIHLNLLELDLVFSEPQPLDEEWNWDGEDFA